MKKLVMTLVMSAVSLSAFATPNILGDDYSLTISVETESSKNTELYVSLDALNQESAPDIKFSKAADDLTGYTDINFSFMELKENNVFSAILQASVMNTVDIRSWTGTNGRWIYDAKPGETKSFELSNATIDISIKPTTPYLVHFKSNFPTDSVIVKATSKEEVIAELSGQRFGGSIYDEKTHDEVTLYAGDVESWIKSITPTSL